MKNKILLCVVLFSAISISISAQLKVYSTGRVKVEEHLAIGTAPASTIGLRLLHTNNTFDPYYGIHSTVKSGNIPAGPICAVYGYADGYVTGYNYPIHPVVGVLGIGRKNYTSENVMCVGVAGLANYYGGIGVYGSCSGINLPSTWNITSNYAGYFNGGVNVRSTLVANLVSTTSDERMKENIEDISLELTQSIKHLNPISYTFKEDSIFLIDKDAKEYKYTHYGLLAQDVQKVFPNLVYERDGILSINYIELIPLLIKAVNAQQEQIDELQAEIVGLKKNSLTSAKRIKSSLHKDEPSKTEIEQAVLYQNNPNPFSVDTKIKYELPLTTKAASLYIYDMNGSQIAQYPISTFGESEIIVSGGVMDAGMYLYSLIADGQVVDTKRMILTK